MAEPKYKRNLIREGRDDTSKLGLGKAGVSFAKMTGKDVMHQPDGVAPKVKKSYDLQKSVLNQTHLTGGKAQSKVFPSMDKVGKVASAIKDSSAKDIVGILLED